MDYSPNEVEKIVSKLVAEYFLKEGFIRVTPTLLEFTKLAI